MKGRVAGESKAGAGVTHIVSVSMIILILSCGEDETLIQTVAPTKTGQAIHNGDQALPPVPKADFPDNVFVENEKNRDPFRSFIQVFDTQTLVIPQRQVMMATTSVDQMRLSAIVTRIPSPRALLVDPTGVGYVVKHGDFVGKAEVKQTGPDTPPVVLNWRVSRIRPGDTKTGKSAQVVLTRTDSSQPDQAPLSRVISMIDDKSGSAEGQ